MGILSSLNKDLNSILKRDPAATRRRDILFAYPGFHALILFRLASFFYRHKYIFIAKLISAFARLLTGIEIHPAAKIGSGLFIDHGSGVVIGETTEIGDNVTIYQGVTLGGNGKEIGKRHPTIGNNVLISAGAKLLGSFKVGDNAKIGAGSVVLREVPANSTVVGVPGKVVKKDGVRISGELDHSLPDPIMDELNKINEKLKEIIEKISKK